MNIDTMTILGMKVEYFVGGRGKPVLVLHDELGFAPEADYVRLLCETRQVLALSLPGFGRSELPDWIDCVDDLAYAALVFLDQLHVGAVDLVGFSLGGWVAAEMATKQPGRFPKLVLCSPFGVKTGPTDRLEIPDVFAMPKTTLDALLFCDPALGRVDAAALSDPQAATIVRNRETFTLLGWEPYLHNPKLRRRLDRYKSPTLFLRGDQDGLVSKNYLEAYAGLLTDAALMQIPNAGHYAHRERPEAFVEHATAFLDG